MYGEVKIPVDTFLELKSKAEKFELIMKIIFNNVKLAEGVEDRLFLKNQEHLIDFLEFTDYKKYKAKLDELKRRKEEKEC